MQHGGFALAWCGRCFHWVHYRDIQVQSNSLVGKEAFCRSRGNVCEVCCRTFASDLGAGCSTRQLRSFCGRSVCVCVCGSHRYNAAACSPHLNYTCLLACLAGRDLRIPFVNRTRVSNIILLETENPASQPRLAWVLGGPGPVLNGAIAARTLSSLLIASAGPPSRERVQQVSK